jgi:hypothetical protein
MAVDTFASFGHKVIKFEESMTDDNVSHALGKMAKAQAVVAASADLGGDTKFSGWAKAPLDTRYDIVGPGRISFHPSRRSAGPWTVAQQGRNQGGATGFAGPGINAKTGASALTKTGKVRSRKAKKWNGTTQGKGTAESAIKLIDKLLPRVVERLMKQQIRRIF